MLRQAQQQPRGAQQPASTIIPTSKHYDDALKLMEYASPALKKELGVEVVAHLRRQSILDRFGDPENSLLDFTQYTFPQYKADRAHELMCQYLDAVINRKIRKLMIIAPPQHGKSELVSIRLPAFWLAKHPNMPVMMASYGSDLAVKHSRMARDIIGSEEYQALFPDIKLDPDHHAANDWGLESPNRGYMKAAGVDGSLTGFGAGLGIIDDLIKDWTEAQSQTVRDTAWNFWKTFRPRLWEGAPIIWINTRWHEDDPAGRMLLEQGDEWVVLHLPALAQTTQERIENIKYYGHYKDTPDDPLGRAPLDALCPTRYSKGELLKIKKDIGILAFEIEYQGIPRPSEGTKFKREWFNIVDEIPSGITELIRYWDKAATEDDGDYTAGVLMARAGTYFYILDVVRGQWSTHNRRNVMRQTAYLDEARYGHVKIFIEQEPASGGKDSIVDDLDKLAGFDVHAWKETGKKLSKNDKEISPRFAPYSAQYEAGNFRLLRAPWNQEFIEEHISVPNGKNDDQVVAGSGAFNRMTKDIQKFFIFDDEQAVITSLPDMFFQNELKFYSGLHYRGFQDSYYLMAAITMSADIYVLHELSSDVMAVSEHAAEIKALEGKVRGKFIRFAGKEIFLDAVADGEGRKIAKVGTDDSIHIQFARNGVAFAQAEGDELAGWVAVRDALKMGRVKIMANCTRLIHSLHDVVHKKPDTMRTFKEETVLDGDVGPATALRHIIMHCAAPARLPEDKPKTYKERVLSRRRSGGGGAIKW